MDNLYFNSFGGEPAFNDIAAEQCAMDNFTFDFIPEPSSLLLTALGAATGSMLITDGCASE